MSNIINNITYENIKNPSLYTGMLLGKNAYEYDEHGNLIQPDPIINATDIDWGGAKLHGLDNLDTTSQLLKYISDIHENGPSGTSYADQTQIILIMFEALRALQAEVLKIRNSFEYGINSLNESNTAISSVVRKYNYIDEEEPLWAIDESELSIIEGFTYDDVELLNIVGQTIISENKDYIIIDNGYWEDTNNILRSATDSKLLLYLTLNSLKGKIYCKDINDEDISIVIDLEQIKEINRLRESQNGIYNILIIISRKQNVNNQLYGNNYVWINIADYQTNNTIGVGYITENSLRLNPVEQEINNQYYFNKIEFQNINLYKLNIYTKYTDFTNSVNPSTIQNPGSLKYEAAHITIRSVATYDLLKTLESQLLENELIYCKDNGKLYIISDHKLKNISVGSEESGGDNPENPDNPPTDETMTIDEILQLFIERGIITVNEDTLNPQNDKYTLNNIESIKFINNETGKTFNFTVNAYGELESSEFNVNKLLSTVINKMLYDSNGELIDKNVFDVYVKHINRTIGPKTPENQTTAPYGNARGFVASLNNAIDIANGKAAKDESKSFGIDADRIKIGAFFAPLNEDSKIGCSHAYIELENTSNKDFPLDGCYLHFGRVISNDGEIKVSHLALRGYIPANGTYLIRGKQYRAFDDPNVYIKVRTFDQEWYDIESGNELIDFTIISKYEDGSNKTNPSFALTYKYENLKFTDKLVIATNSNIYDGNTKLAISTKSDFPYLYDWRFIDAISVNTISPWTIGQGAFVLKSNSIYKNMFELDPAKQAYNSLNKKDSSRSRFQNSATDLQTLELNNEYIYFPKSKDISKNVALYTPKASFEHKNVQTDKTKLEINKPNAVTVSFGTNIFTTRCFNWISCGMFDEYVFLYDKNHNFVGKFESFKHVDNNNLFDAYKSTENPTYPRRKEFPQNVINICYTSLTLPRLYNYFPADGSYYTSHKCIIDICGEAPSTPETWSYVIARLDKNGNPDPEYCSDEMHFTMYPDTYEPKIYQTTDQQGFHWQEYQVWAACAKKLNDIIKQECEGQNIIPILINTGDMTQSGARVSEWLDYYNAGHYLFDHLEQMNIVGNNDLAPSKSVNIVGTGDDADKSNAYFYHVFYCYEVNPIYLDNDTNKENPIYPIINNVYIPSFYYIDIRDIRLLFLNSELTLETCKTWYKINYTASQAAQYNKTLNGAVNTNDPKTNEQVNAYNATITGAVKPGDDNGNGGVYTEATANEKNATLEGAFIAGTSYSEEEANLYNVTILTGAYPLTDITINAYTGYGINSNLYYADKFGFTTIYTMLYHMTEDISKKYIAICHEMPFTVITRDSLIWNASADSGQISVFRSLSAANALIGCHMNQIDKTDTKIGVYWFSRLLEYRGIKLCLGGHKHTYCCTYPVAENYKYINNGILCWSLQNGPMPMEETLNSEIEKSVKWTWGKGEEKIREVDGITGNIIDKVNINHSKTPLVVLTEDELNSRYVQSYKNKIVNNENALINDNYIYEWDNTNYEVNGAKQIIFLPCHIISETWSQNHNISPVIYFMCQATGYKLTSNKELPTPKQRFSILVPKTNDSGSSDSPNANQRNPMYAVITINSLSKTYDLELIRMRGIFNDTNPTNLTTIKGFNFNQQNYGKLDIDLQYTKLPDLEINNSFNSEYNYGSFTRTKTNLFTNNSL